MSVGLYTEFVRHFLKRPFSAAAGDLGMPGPACLRRRLSRRVCRPIPGSEAISGGVGSKRFCLLLGRLPRVGRRPGPKPRVLRYGNYEPIERKTTRARTAGFPPSRGVTRKRLPGTITVNFWDQPGTTPQRCRKTPRNADSCILRKFRSRKTYLP